MAATSSTAAGIAWDLSDLYAGVDDPALPRDGEAGVRDAEAFAATYRGKINVPGGPAADFLLQAVQALEALSERVSKPVIFAHLLHAARTDNPRHGALLSRTREQSIAASQHLIFFDLEWIAVDDEVAARLIADPVLARYTHWLEQKRAWKKHYLSEPEEKVLQQKSITGRAAFVRLFDETNSTLAFPYEHGTIKETASFQVMNARLQDPDRTIRQAAARGLTQGLKDNARLLTYIFNTLVLDHRTDFTMRGFPDPMAARNLENEIRPEVVAALMTAAERYHPTVHRYYSLKRRLLNLEQLFDHDRYAPVAEEMPTCDWPTAREMVQASYDAFSPVAGNIVREFFDRRWIDADPRPAKRSGAFSAGTVPSVHPYILINWQDRLRDVSTLAHELGHGIHQYLSRGVGLFQADTPLTTAETASVFGEMLTFQQLLTRFPEPKVKLALLCRTIEDAFATVFRQVVLTRFEQKLHEARHSQGELTPEAINVLWLDVNRPMFGDSVTLTEDYGWWWMYIGHFIHSPFYCYAYAFGELLVLALVQKYREEGPTFVPRYLDLLSAGGSAAPHVLLARLDVDVNDPGFWELGLKLLDGMVAEAEMLAGQV
jgi:oligoendopeptidase F